MNIKVVHQAMMAKQADWVPDWMKASGRWIDRNVVTPAKETAHGIALAPGRFVKDIGSSSKKMIWKTCKQDPRYFNIVNSYLDR